MSDSNLIIILNERPTGQIVPGQTFHQKIEPIPKSEEVKTGQVLVETLYLGLEPAMRGWISDARSYVPPVELGAVMRGYSAARVLFSKSSNAKVGDIIHAPTGWSEYAIVSDQEFEPEAHFPGLAHPKDMISFMGIPAITAWLGMTLISEPKAGDLVVISAAAGAVGSIAGQIAKMKGAKVVGTAGSDEKCRWLKELGFDEVLSYKDSDFEKKFVAATSDLIDLYWDNVGGHTLDLAMGQAKLHSRFVMCGQISGYNDEAAYPYKNLNFVTLMRVKMQGFICTDHMDRWGDARADLGSWIKDGKLKTAETVIKGGLKEAEGALVGIYKGINRAKLMVEVKNPDLSALKV